MYNVLLSPMEHMKKQKVQFCLQAVYNVVGRKRLMLTKFISNSIEGTDKKCSA